MGSNSMCKENNEKVLWITEYKSVILTGKTGKNTGTSSATDCWLTFGLATKKENARLVLHFDFIHIGDCKVKLQVNESRTSDLEDSDKNHEIYMASCKTMNPKSVYARPKQYLLVRLIRDDKHNAGYNFHLNVTMADALPRSGPELHVVIIVCFVVGLVVLTAIYLLFKYLSRLSFNLREQQSEEAMTRAISIYNSQSQDRLREPEMVHIEPAHSHNNHHTSGPEIAFVYSDGRIQRFRTEAPPNPSVPPVHSPRNKRADKKHAGRTQGGTTSPLLVEPESSGRQVSEVAQDQEASSIPLLHDAALAGRSAGDVSATGDLGYEVPPSYEEALCMPEPFMTNAIIDDLSEDLSDVDSIQGRLRVDYVNTAPCRDTSDAAPNENSRQGTIAQEDYVNTSDRSHVLFAFPSRLKDS